MQNLVGVAKEVQVTPPGAFGGLFGNTVYSFVLDLNPNQVSLPSGTQVFNVPVAIECFRQVPGLENRSITLNGEFDLSTGLFRGKNMMINDFEMRVNAARRFRLIPALLINIATLLAWLMLFGLGYRTVNFVLGPSPLRYKVLGVVAFVAIWFLISLIGTILFRITGPSLQEAQNRWLRRFTEYQ